MAKRDVPRHSYGLFSGKKPSEEAAAKSGSGNGQRDKLVRRPEPRREIEEFRVIPGRYPGERRWEPVRR